MLAVAALAAGLLSGCGLGGKANPSGGNALPKVGTCRMLDPSETQPLAAPEVACTAEHNAQTYHAAKLTGSLAEADYRSRAVEVAAATSCGALFPDQLGTDLSTAMRSLVTWRVFWPSKSAWRNGSTWFGCDVIGGPRSPGSTELALLPEQTEGMLTDDRARERWLACVAGPSVTDGLKVPCTKDHDWRAVTTIKLGEPTDPYPGDRAVVQRTEDFCGSSVKAWLSYPETFDFAYTWFGKGAWEGGNRRSVCWARTNR